MDRRLFLAALALAPSAAWAAESEEKKKGGGLNYIQIPPLTGTVTRSDGRRGVLTVETGVDVPDRALNKLAEASTPRLRAAYAQVVMTYAAGLSPGSPPNADYLSRELQRQTDLVLGRPGARLLLGTILVN
ncbi:MAG: hypothetical protein JWO33_469 [Caulobacteraceae bacterium]|nr:hypothetical protein [Caulobacteraceae bacterium]